MSHLDAGVLSELVDGEIPSSQLGPIQLHLSTCPECRARLDEERRLVADVDGLIEALDVPQSTTAATIVAASSRRKWYRDIAWAASVVLAAGVGFALRGTVQRTASPPAAADQAKSVASAPSNASTAAPRDTALLVPPAPTAARAEAPRVRTTGSIAKAAPQPAAGLGADAVAPSSMNAAGAASATERRSEPLAQKASERTDSQLRPAAPPSIAAGARLDLASRGGGRGGRGGAPIDTLSFPDALRRLGGTLRIIDGLVPLRLEWQEPYVRVVYPDGVILRQQLVDGQITFDVFAPAAISRDSVSRLRARVRE